MLQIQSLLWPIYSLQMSCSCPRILSVICSPEWVTILHLSARNHPLDEVENDAGNQDGEVSRRALPFLRRDDSGTGKSCKQASIAETRLDREFRRTKFSFLESTLPRLPEGKFLQDCRCSGGGRHPRSIEEPQRPKPASPPSASQNLENRNRIGFDFVAPLFRAASWFCSDVLLSVPSRPLGDCPNFHKELRRQPLLHRRIQRRLSN